MSDLVRAGDAFEAVSAAPGYQPNRCTVVAPCGGGWCMVTYAHGGADRPMRVQSLLDAKQWRRIARPEAAQPAHKPPATVTLRWCPECGEQAGRWRHSGHMRRLCPGTVRVLSYDLRAEPQERRVTTPFDDPIVQACLDHGGHFWPAGAPEGEFATCTRCRYNPGWVNGKTVDEDGGPRPVRDEPQG